MRPLRNGKGSVYEGGVRVPFIAHWPRTIEAGRVIETPVHAIDILPTCFDLAGARLTDDHVLDGVSLRRLLLGDQESFAHRPLFQYYPFYDLRWGNTPCASIRLGDYKLIEFFGDRVDSNHQYRVGNQLELYNLREDLGESSNLMSVEPERAAEMRKQLHGWMESLNAEVPRANKHFQRERTFLETRNKPSWLQGVRWSRPR